MVELSVATKCPACGSGLSQEGRSVGLCPGCLLELALESPSLLAELEDSDKEATLAYSREVFSPGQILGKRYRIRSLLGRGGIGEVWRAYDLKLRVEIALKALRTQLLADARALETLRQEVRVAREVISPNVCRVFDLVEMEAQELVSMEYIDGITLLDILKMRAPLDLTEAREIASQLLAGLEAIHDAGLVHRDVKPENLMMTRSGRVVLMDFGIAKGLADIGTGTVSGTPAYMAPEQARGEVLDARVDVFSAGVVLAEMIAPGGVRTFEARQEIWQGIHHEPPEICDSPWAPVLKKAVAAQREHRYSSATALARALEEVTLRVAGTEDLKPYPGLASFTEADAEYFFGRELEVEEMWKKLQRPHLLGLIGPSGAGKSSFLWAGLLPVIPTGWRAVVMTPGSRPMSALARALVPELAGNTEALQLLTSSDDAEALVVAVTLWRQQHDETLLIVDQFEELFTQNPKAIQERFSQLLSRLALETDVHVLLSMRDDFLVYCSHQESLKPIFSELTPLKPLTGPAVRRALVQPAVKCGYRFEDDSLVDEMVGELGSERGALPMLAFAASRLWDHRDREQGLLTGEAYEHIGGVGGALAQHAEATLEQIGEDRIPIVREVFRNLVTAQGTRAARDREELLSVFGGAADVGVGLAPARSDVGEGLAPSREGTSPSSTTDRGAAQMVLNHLIDARLLTSYEVPGEEGEESHHRIEIIHESLLTHWPRLVRWQTQDADSAQLRDQIRQAAQMWEERGRPEDLLWTGTSFKEYELWRERYAGGLSADEESFTRAMTAKAARQRRRRHLAVGGAIVVLLAIAATLAFFWYRSETARQEAVAAEMKAEASNLYGLARMQPEDEPAAFLAYAIASLEHGDNPEVRWEVLRALWRGPPAFRIPAGSPVSLEFSPDGRWLATANRGPDYRLWPSDGGPPTVLEGTGDWEPWSLVISPKVDVIAHPRLFGEPAHDWREVALRSFPEGKLLRTLKFDKGSTELISFSLDGEHLFTNTGIKVGEGEIREIRSWPVAGGDPDLLARIELQAWRRFPAASVDATASRMVWVDSGEVFLASVTGGILDRESGTRLDHEKPVRRAGFDRQGLQLATVDTENTARVWSLQTEIPRLIHTITGKGIWFGFDWADLTRGVAWGEDSAGLWDVSWPPDAEPLPLLCADELFDNDPCWQGVAFHPQGEWVGIGNRRSVSLWPLLGRYPYVFRGHEGEVQSIEFTPRGEWLVSADGDDGTIRIWPLDSTSGERSRILYRVEEAWGNPLRMAMFPDGSAVVIGTETGRVAVLPLAGGPVSELSGFTDAITALAVGPDNRFVAAGSGWEKPEECLVRVWDLVTGEVHILDQGNPEPLYIHPVKFTHDGDLLFPTDKYRRWELGGADPLLLAEKDRSDLPLGMVRDLTSDGRFALVTQAPGWGELVIRDIEAGTTRELTAHGPVTNRAVFDPTGKIVVSADARSGAIHVGLASGGDTHVLLGHKTGSAALGLLGYDALAVSPDGHWIASGGADGTIRLWPMPDPSQPPLHTLPRDELIAKLRTLTNLRVVEDAESASGWKLEVGPFPGWEEVPTW